jgi:hypothetical protein
MLQTPAPRNTFQTRHGAAEGAQSSGALPLDQCLENFANQRRFLSASRLLGKAVEIIIKIEGGSHNY